MQAVKLFIQIEEFGHHPNYIHKVTVKGFKEPNYSPFENPTSFHN